MLKFLKNNIGIIIILVLAGFLRFYKLADTFIVIPETGADLLIARDAIVNHTIPLHGVVTSHTWLVFGPLYWWILELVLFVFKFNPTGHAVLGRVVSILTVLMIYLFVERIVNKRTGIFTAILVAVSPIFMQTARVGRHDSFTIFISSMFLYILSYSEKKKLVKPFLIGLILGIGINFEYTFLLLIPVFFSFVFLRKIKYGSRDVLKVLIGFTIPFIPLIIYDIWSKQEMLVKIILWVPYRVFGYFHIIHSNIDVPSFTQSSYSIWRLIPDSFLLNSTIIVTIILIIVVLIPIAILLKQFKQQKITSGELLILLSTFWYVAGLVIHTNPPSHYFDEILFIPIILVCFLANKFWKHKSVRFAFLSFTFIVVLSNANYYFSNNWFYKNYENQNNSYVSQTHLTRDIIKDAKGKPYSLGRVGLFDDRQGNFADNYKYLLWYEGNQPVAAAKYKYIIYEDMNVYKTDLKKREHINNFQSGLFGVIEVKE